MKMLLATTNKPTGSASCKDESFYLRRKPALLRKDSEQRPTSPAPSLLSESESESSLASLDDEHEHFESPLPNSKRRKFTNKNVTFSFSENDPKIKASASDVSNKYGRDTRSDMWWSAHDLKEIMKREGKFVLDLKISTASNKDVIPLSSSLKHTINDTFKKCVDAPAVLSEETKSSLVLSWEESAPTTEDNKTNDTNSTTRGLERYVAPILSAHRQMVVQSLLASQTNLSKYHPITREKILSERYAHMSKVANNFAIVMGQIDEQIAATL